MKHKSQRGQVLLIIVLVSTVLLTVGLSLSQITTQETKIAKLEEESKKAFAAAEAGIEARLRSESNINIPSILPPNSGISAGQAIVDQTQKSTFITPLLKKDEQYTFYLSEYNPQEKQITGNPFSGNMRINLKEPGNTCAYDQTKLAVELTFINKENFTLVRKLIDPCPIISGTIDEINFGSSFKAPSAHLLILRIIAPNVDFPGAKLEIVNENGNWPLQGKTIISQATTQTGVSKKIKLFQSYPQIPAEFFVTSF